MTEKHHTDLQKRATLKKMGVAGVGLALAGTPAMAAWQHATDQSGVASTFPSATRGVPDLKIDIVATTSVPVDTVVFTNMTDNEIAIRHFLPGSIIFDAHYLDLNSVKDDAVIRIPPKGVVSRPVRLSRLVDNPVREYVWADDAVTPITEHTKVVSLGAFAADERLIVYPIPQLDQTGVAETNVLA